LPYPAYTIEKFLGEKTGKEKKKEPRMARSPKKIAKRRSEKQRRKTPKRSSPNVSGGDQDTLGVLDGNMKNILRAAFLNRP